MQRFGANRPTQAVLHDVIQATVRQGKSLNAGLAGQIGLSCGTWGQKYALFVKSAY